MKYVTQTPRSSTNQKETKKSLYLLKIKIGNYNVEFKEIKKKQIKWNVWKQVNVKKRGREVKELSTTCKNSSLLSSKTLREVSEVANQTCRIIIVSVYN